jgi:hypothetical protein
MRSDGIKWRCVTTLRKYREDVDEFRKQHGLEAGERLFGYVCSAYETRVIEGNLALQEGIKELFTLLTGGSATVFSNANARLGVGNGTAEAEDTQTDLQGGSKAYKAMDTSYPVVGELADKKVTFRSTFGSAEGNFAWEEWVIDNGGTGLKTLNRKVESLGTKSSGSWQLTVEISLA